MDGRPRTTSSSAADDRVHLPREALDVVAWLEGEGIRSVWASGLGYLVVTNLRCVLLARGAGSGTPNGWYAGPEYFFFNFAEPQLVGVLEIGLAEEFLEGREARLPVRDPAAVQKALAEAREAGKLEWSRRRAADERTMPIGRPAIPDGRPLRASDPGRTLLKAPCRSCGNLFDSSGIRCPFCGTPRVSARRRRSGPR